MACIRLFLLLDWHWYSAWSSGTQSASESANTATREPANERNGEWRQRDSQHWRCTANEFSSTSCVFSIPRLVVRRHLGFHRLWFVFNSSRAPTRINDAQQVTCCAYSI